MVDIAQLYDNCVYSSIAHAIFVLKEPFFEAEQSWDGLNYSFNDFSGIRGTISFDLSRNILAGAVRNDNSERRNRYPEFKAIELFANAPESVKQLAEAEALQYLFDEKDGVTQPMATAAFWSVGGEIVIDEDIEEFKANGGEYLFEIGVSHDELRDYWRYEYDFGDEELAAVDLIYERFKAHEVIRFEDVPIIKTKDVQETQKRGLFGHKKKVVEQEPDGYVECIACLGELGIVIE